MGRYAQHFVDALQMDTTPVEYLLAKYPTVRGYIYLLLNAAPAHHARTLSSPPNANLFIFKQC